MAPSAQPVTWEAMPGVRRFTFEPDRVVAVDFLRGEGAQADDPAVIAEFEQNLAAKINSLTADPDKAREFGQAGRQRCIDEFSWAKIAGETVDVYRQAIEVHRR